MGTRHRGFEFNLWVFHGWLWITMDLYGWCWYFKGFHDFHATQEIRNLGYPDKCHHSQLVHGDFLRKVRWQKHVPSSGKRTSSQKRWMMRKWMQNPTSSFFELKKLVGRGIFNRLHSSHSFHCSETACSERLWNMFETFCFHLCETCLWRINNKNRGARLNLHRTLIMPWPTDQASKPAVSSTRKKAKLCKWSRP